jgi:MFS family permease
MIMFGLGLAMLTACFDGTIVGTCAPAIVADLKGAELYAWMVTAYMLCETVMIPISGKLSDLYGRKPLFLIGLTLFVSGSIVAGLSTSMEMFIVCRAVQGLGGGILIPVATPRSPTSTRLARGPRCRGYSGPCSESAAG